MLPEDNGLLISQSFGKTATLDDPHNFAIFSSADQEICPVSHLGKLISNSALMGYDYCKGHMFRVKDNKSKIIVDKPVSSSAMADPLPLHIKLVTLYDGETSHSSRRRCAITLELLNISKTGISQHIKYWICIVFLCIILECLGLCSMFYVHANLAGNTFLRLLRHESIY